MLAVLHIENIAVVERAELEFGPGLNVLTGETGAGKSIVIDAIGAVLGGRTSRELVRAGAKGASVTAVFRDADAADWCEENGIEQEDELLLMRRITAEGKNACRVNGVPVSVAQLRALGSLLLDIHGQHDGQLLLNEQHHLHYLDSFAPDGAAMSDYRRLYSAYRTARKDYDALQMDEREKARRVERLREQIRELEEADIRPGEEKKLRARRDFLQNAGKLSDAVEGAFLALYGDDERESALDLIGEAENHIQYALQLSETFGGLSQVLTELRYTAEDAAEQLRDIRESLDFSPGEFDKIQARLQQLDRLAIRYGATEEEMLAYLESCRRELNSIATMHKRQAECRQALQAARQAVTEAGAALTSVRQKAAKELEARIIAELSGLNMQGVRFAVEIEKQEKAPGFDKTGMDTVRFLMSANAGENLGKISKIASGGELSRIMLAMKNVLAQGEQIGTMVFDEIDAGVSGIAAQRVGEKLSDLGRIRQVLCVTHLPQIAAVADRHFSIGKAVRGGRTFTEISPLDDPGRVREIARLTGGDHISELTLASAREQLSAARVYKEGKPRP